MSTKYFIALSLVVILVVAFYRYDQYIIARNFVVVADIACDPSAESCFVADCSTQDDPDCDTTPYKKVTILAAEAPICLEEHSCEGFVCTSASCTVSQCSEDELEDGEACLAEGTESEDGQTSETSPESGPSDQIAPQ
jgi:hypothetical protein